MHSRERLSQLSLGFGNSQELLSWHALSDGHYLNHMGETQKQLSLSRNGKVESQTRHPLHLTTSFFPFPSQSSAQSLQCFSSLGALPSRRQAVRGAELEALQTSSTDFKGPLRSLLRFKHFDGFPAVCFRKALKCFIIDAADLFPSFFSF